VVTATALVFLHGLAFAYLCVDRYSDDYY